MLPVREPHPFAAPPGARIVLILHPAYRDPGTMAGLAVRAVQQLAAGIERACRADPTDGQARFHRQAYRAWLDADEPMDIYLSPDPPSAYLGLVPHAVHRAGGLPVALAIGPVPPAVLAPLLRDHPLERF